jgi:hypothetical protein
VRAAPEGVSNAEGDWMYQEWLNGGGVRQLDLEEAPPAVVTPPAQKIRGKRREKHPDLWRRSSRTVLIIAKPR